jgi:hypothetical protein
MLDELFNKFLETKFAEIFGPNYRNISGLLNRLIDLYKEQKEQVKAINQRSQKIAELEKADSTLSGNIGIINRHYAGITNQLSQKIAELEKTVTDNIRITNDKNRELAKKIADLESKNKPLPSRIDENVQIDGIITQFNSWAANPTGPVPYGFTFLAGDPGIRTHQQIVETAEETKWITNRTGQKKYLLPNPNSFHPMTNISEFYDMDQSMLQQKGRNKIQIIVPCEISGIDWIEFRGKLKILP